MPEHRPGFVHFRFQTALQKDDRHAHVADEFRQVKVGKLETQAISPGQHSYDKEHQQGRHSELGADLIGKNGDENQYGKQQQQVAGCEVYRKHLLQD